MIFKYIKNKIKMTLIWSITFEGSSYSDTILHDIVKGTYEVFLSGQDCGREDKLITEAIQNKEMVKIYYRVSKTEDFIYLGSTTEGSVIKERTKGVGEKTRNDERLYVKFKIYKPCVVNRKLKSEFEGYCKYKKEVMKENGIEGKRNLCSAFLKC